MMTPAERNRYKALGKTRRLDQTISKLRGSAVKCGALERERKGARR